MTRSCPSCEAYQEKLSDLRRLFLGDGIEFPIEWRLTAKDEIVLRVLIARGVASQDQLFAALYRDEIDPPVSLVVAQRVSRLRKKVRSFGLTIFTNRSRGYALEDHQVWKRRLGQGNAAA
jgi:DNA-binding response OmpR family regulator